MAITLVGFVAARVAVAAGGRPRFQESVMLRYPVETDVVPNQFRDDWVMSDAIYDEDGNLLQRNARALCTEPEPTAQPSTVPETPAPEAQPGEDTCSTDYNLVTFQPGDRFWLFQYFETGILLGLSALLILLAVHQIRRRIS